MKQADAFGPGDRGTTPPNPPVTNEEKAARISNAAAQEGRSKSSVGRKGGESGSYEDWTVPDLRKRAKELGLAGYSGKKKAELVKALREH
ncbi:SAP domain-containing protein [Aeromicrobium chenweiae]|uniref:SAP domain-containing protein n=1 Tax=Aeromicrobium chenweiae TaxID=2079793 RepID=UPI001F36E7F0|nr:SAP domain-containing protein [Aeromicrobium chenweiae]